MTIGSLAQTGGVNVETIRYYQRRGLLAEPARPAGGIRRYDSDDLARLHFIKSAQRLGFSLNEVSELLRLDDGANCEAVSSLAEAHLADVRERLTALARMEEALSALVTQCRKVDSENQLRCPLIEALHETR